jgi:ornithine decarboxylase
MNNEPYSFPLERYMTRERFERIQAFAADKETPCLIIDLDIIEQKFREMKQQMPFAKVFYAVTANPKSEVVSLLHELGSGFDVASRPELDQLLSLGVDPSKVSYGNTIKKARDVQYFYDRGVRLFATDSEEDLRTIAKIAPKSRVYFRIITEGTGSDWPLSRKFGAHADVIFNLIKIAKELGLDPYGLSFHVGSQQRDIGQWDDAIARCTYLFEACHLIGIDLKMINLGGGFPASYLEATQPLEVYTGEIKRFLREDFPVELPEICVEPGRSFTADAGVLVAEVVLVSKKSKNNLYRWVYLDVGMFGGLIETMGEAIKYPIYFDKTGNSEEIILAGPTCDSMDVMYETFKYRMPSSVEAGDRVYLLTTGAYTQSYHSVYFNGFPPLETYVMPRA